MKKVAKFEKISFDQFLKDYQSTFPNIDENTITGYYNNLKLPKRATLGSAGYDFFIPFDLTLTPGETIKIPTGIRVQIDEGYFLQITPRSGLGFKFRLQLDNTLGIIDSDYYNSSNEGHIFIKMTNLSTENKVLNVLQGQAVAQGIFIEFGITYDDECEELRNGGFGSTTK